MQYVQYVQSAQSVQCKDCIDRSAYHAVQFVHAGVWVVGGQMEGRVSVQRSGDRVPRKERRAGGEREGGKSSQLQRSVIL